MKYQYKVKHKLEKLGFVVQNENSWNCIRMTHPNKNVYGFGKGSVYVGDDYISATGRFAYSLLEVFSTEGKDHHNYPKWSVDETKQLIKKLKRRSV